MSSFNIHVVLYEFRMGPLHYHYCIHFSRKCGKVFLFSCRRLSDFHYGNRFSDFSVLHHAFISSEMGGNTKRKWRKIYTDDIVNIKSEVMFRKLIQMQNTLVKHGPLNYVHLSESEHHLSKKSKHLIFLVTKYILLLFFNY